MSQVYELTSVESNSTPSRGVGRLMLSQFRSYSSLSLDLDTRSVVLTGPNGAGKTNILEALSFLLPGRGLRSAKLGEAKRMGSSHPWAVSASLVDGGVVTQIGTGLDPESVEREKRITKIDGQKVKSQNVLAEYVSLSWITPQMDRLFLDGASNRRRFLDRIVYGFDKSHASRLNRYEHRLRERSQLLKQGGADPQWLGSLEAALAEEAVAITAARREVVGQLNQALKAYNGVFPRAILSLSGSIEEQWGSLSALEVEEWLRDAFVRSRYQDQFTGGSQVGPHRSDLDVIHADKKIPASLCSTGEQKTLLISITLAASELQSIRKQTVPLLLLDEVVAHLDKKRRIALFEKLLGLKIQAWLTGTEKQFFMGLEDFAHFVRVEEGTIAEIQRPNV